MMIQHKSCTSLYMGALPTVSPPRLPVVSSPPQRSHVRYLRTKKGARANQKPEQLTFDLLGKAIQRHGRMGLNGVSGSSPRRLLSMSCHVMSKLHIHMSKHFPPPAPGRWGLEARQEGQGAETFQGHAAFGAA
jgi:hypothetical protein